MDHIEQVIAEATALFFKTSFDARVPAGQIQVQQTRKEFSGDKTVVVFPLLKYSGKGPEQTAEETGTFLCEKLQEIVSFNVVKGFLNLTVHPGYWHSLLVQINEQEHFGCTEKPDDPRRLVVEYSSPNTNKPLHLGHIRNILLGHALSKIIQANGDQAAKVNIVNDRGIHICKSMLAWKKWGKGITPGQAGMKGDKLVGEYYVRFEQEYRKQVASLRQKGMSEQEAVREAAIIKEAQEMLRKWEAGDSETWSIWRMMNDWVEEGFNKTYERLGVDFDKIYYESDTYKLGRDIILQGLENGLLIRKEDGSVWADLSEAGLDEKILLRSDGTSVYMTQDIGLAEQRYAEYRFDRHIYVVGNEQDYHFQVLKLVLAKLGYRWAEHLYHLSYGMVELPDGKMKSREGTVVDADDLLDEMLETARNMSHELGKLEGYNHKEKEEIVRRIGLGALKYFILKVDPRKNMVFDPVESVDFNGNTGPFIQYTYARIRSVLRKAAASGQDRVPDRDLMPVDKEISLIKLLSRFPRMVQDALEDLNPSLIANYTYELAKEFNQFYHDHSILSADHPGRIAFRLMLSENVSKVIRTAFDMLGIDVPERM